MGKIAIPILEIGDFQDLYSHRRNITCGGYQNHKNPLSRKCVGAAQNWCTGKHFTLVVPKNVQDNGRHSLVEHRTKIKLIIFRQKLDFRGTFDSWNHNFYEVFWSFFWKNKLLLLEIIQKSPICIENHDFNGFWESFFDLEKSWKNWKIMIFRHCWFWGWGQKLWRSIKKSGRKGRWKDFSENLTFI